MDYKLEDIHTYGYAPVGNLRSMIREAIVQLIALGKTMEETAGILGIAKSTLWRYCKEFDLTFDVNVGRKKLRYLTWDTYKRLQHPMKDVHRTNIEIAKLLGVDRHTLGEWVEENKPKRGRPRKGVAI